MRIVKVSLNAAGFSQWIPVDYVEAWFGIGVAVIPSEDANLTYSVQHTFDPTAAIESTYGGQNISISRAGTVATVTDTGTQGFGHGLTTGDNAIIKSSGSSYLDSPLTSIGNGELGRQVASTPSPTTYTYTVSNSGPTADGGNAKCSRLRVFPHATLNGQTTRGSGSYNYPVRAVRLYISSYTAGYADFIVVQGNAA